MKKLVSILSILTIVFSLSLTACGGQEEEIPEASPETPAESEPAEMEMEESEEDES